MNEIFITGQFSRTPITLYSSTSNIVLNNNGSQNTFIAHYDLSGNAVWGSVIGGTGSNSGTSICTDDTHLYVIGQFSDTSLTLYSYNTPSSIVLNNNGSTNTFIAKYDLNGNPLWGSVIGGTNSNQGNSICTDDTYVYVTGSFIDASLTLYSYNTPSSIVLNNNGTGSTNTFIAQYDLSGNAVWGSVIGGTSGYIGISICTDYKYLYVTGFFIGGLTLYSYNTPSDIVLNNIGSHNTFIAQYDLSGNPLWGSVIGGTNFDQGTSVCTDSKYLYVTGQFSDASLTLYSYNTPSDIVLINNGTSNTFIAQYDLSGNAIWGSVIGGAGGDSGNGDSSTSICTDSKYLYVTGQFSDASLTLYSYNTPSDIVLINNGTSNTFIAQYDLSGNAIWGSVIGGAGGDSANSIYTDNSYVYVTGYFSDASLTFYSYNTPSITINNTVVNGKGDYESITFIAKYDLSGNPIWGRGINAEQGNSICVAKNVIPISNICFIAGTPITTDQGIYPIEELTDQTINNQKINIVKTISYDDYLICIEKNAFGNIPFQDILITKNHKIICNGTLIQAGKIINDKVYKTLYNGEILYNVLLEENGIMIVSGLLCETLDVNNVIARSYKNKKVTKQLNKHIHDQNYKQIAIDLLS